MAVVVVHPFIFAMLPWMSSRSFCVIWLRNILAATSKKVSSSEVVVTSSSTALFLWEAGFLALDAAAAGITAGSASRSCN